MRHGLGGGGGGGGGLDAVEFKAEVDERRRLSREGNCFTNRWRVFVFLAVWQSIFIILFGVFVDYDVTAQPPPNGTVPSPDNPIGSFYPSK